MVKINGKDFDVSGKTIAEYLTEANYNLKYIAVERNGEIVTKGQYASTVLADGDTVNIVSFVGGG
ncbi:hypothetical protein CCDG5_1409 [[Clostridium] cellulosi]|jgi:sulfur carrier protein ThiS|uniref:Thiamine biosynthesis protein ThiS n=1 Tax=[Clostridium] cellulosi TaxID=29343 RepID=A0A078KQ21_9FIRM|nr:hypothetical protein CCDG5_1409 [[Clostridium] cellulosi]